MANFLNTLKLWVPFLQPYLPEFFYLFTTIADAIYLYHPKTLKFAYRCFCCLPPLITGMHCVSGQCTCITPQNQIVKVTKLGFAITFQNVKWPFLHTSFCFIWNPLIISESTLGGSYKRSMWQVCKLLSKLKFSFAKIWLILKIDLRMLFWICCYP